jgi:hypothetical protein
MRKLAPMFVFPTIAALAGGTAFATTTPMSTTGKSIVPGSGPTTGLSNSDKGTSLADPTRLDGAAAAGTKQLPQHSAAMGMDKDDQPMTGHMTLAQKRKAEKMRMKKAKLARAGDSTMMNRTPVATANGAPPNATTGTYGGK